MLLLLGALTLLAQPADLILRNGKIVTVDARFRIVPAMAVRGDRIVLAGADAAVLRLRGPKTQIVDLGGKTVLPGLIDSHTHALDASLYEFDHEIPDMETMADVLAYVRARAKVVPEGEWIALAQVFVTRLREQRYPTRAELDAAAPRHPVIFSTGPDAALNTLGLARNGITKDSQPPAGQSGKVEVDARGELTGMVRSYSSLVNAPRTGRPITDADRLARLKLLMADYNSLGITSFSDRAASASEVEIYRTLRQRGELSCRVFLNYHVDLPNRDWKEVEAEIEHAAADPLHRYDNMLWLRGLKVFLDGGMLTGSALMREPWGRSETYMIADPEYRGMRYIGAERLYELARTSLKSDLQFTAHAVGDGAVHALIDAYERVDQNDFKVAKGRPCLTHANFLSPEALEKMARLGIVADLQPAWLERDGATLLKHFGDARLRYFQPYASLFKSRIVVGGGSDHMQKIGGMRATNPYHPFYGMWVTLARQPRWTSAVIHPEEKITREQAIRLYTINNAFLTFEEKEKGSLEAGKLADFIVLRQDILTCPQDEVKNIQVEATYLGGRRVFAR